MSGKRLTGRIVLEATGRKRPPYEGGPRWGPLGVMSDQVSGASDELRVVENTIREVERPSQDAVALAKLCHETGECDEADLRCVGTKRRALVDAILAAEAAFAEPEAESVVATPAVQLEPAKVTSRPVDASDAITLAKAVEDISSLGNQNSARMLALDILNRSEMTNA